ncbi:unnamed protein product [Nezara viridula]|uniref:Uncharacterized protein n=1 Tax=Nezara viridula TaxID=85310 RepID=A0A9P0MQW4_NEZVI|nr:unnamed protein product [Nezara viridula]
MLVPLPSLTPSCSSHMRKEQTTTIVDLMPSPLFDCFLWCGSFPPTQEEVGWTNNFLRMYCSSAEIDSSSLERRVLSFSEKWCLPQFVEEWQQRGPGKYFIQINYSRHIHSETLTNSCPRKNNYCPIGSTQQRITNR